MATGTYLFSAPPTMIEQNHRAICGVVIGRAQIIAPQPLACPIITQCATKVDIFHRNLMNASARLNARLQDIVVCARIFSPNTALQPKSCACMPSLSVRNGSSLVILDYVIVCCSLKPIISE